MQTRLDDRVTEVRRKLTPTDEAPWVLLFDDPADAPLTAMAVADALAHMDDEMTRNLAHIIDEVPANAAVLVAPRDDGSPRAADRQLWEDLDVEPCGTKTQLLDLVVVGERGYWSARAERDSRFAGSHPGRAPGSRRGRRTAAHARRDGPMDRPALAPRHLPAADRRCWHRHQVHRTASRHSDRSARLPALCRPDRHVGPALRAIPTLT